MEPPEDFVIDIATSSTDVYGIIVSANGPGLTVIPMFGLMFEHPLASTFTILKFVEFGGHMLIGRFVALSLPRSLEQH